jgi:hypothetical protein
MVRDIIQYRQEYLKDYAFERVMVEYRHRFVAERIRKCNPRTVLEIGCGSQMLYGRYLAASPPPELWLIVEPNVDFARNARESNLPNLRVITDFFENAIPNVVQGFGSVPEMVVCSGLLNEVTSAADLLAAIEKVMDRGTLLHVNTPNAASFHRRLALAMGIIPVLATPSERNRKLSQHRIFDLDSLRAQLVDSGLIVGDAGGYFIKPFTHDQMAAIAPTLSEQVFDGLYEMGKNFPDWGAEIFAEASLA